MENQSLKLISVNDKKQKESVFFNLKQLEGDHSIFLGQSILALIALNQSAAYSDDMNHGFIVELFASLIEELNITPEELRKELDHRNLDEYYISKNEGNWIKNMNYLGEIESIILDLEDDSPELAYQLKKRFQCSCTASELLLCCVSFQLQIQYEIKPEIGHNIKLLTW